MIRFSIGARIRLLVVCLTALITVLFAGIGWIILLDAEDAEGAIGNRGDGAEWTDHGA